MGRINSGAMKASRRFFAARGFFIWCTSKRKYLVDMMPRKSIFPLAILALAAILSGGCERAPILQFQSSEQVKALKPEVQKQILETLEKYCGTPDRPKLLGDDKIPVTHLLHGRDVFMKRCVQCHGVTGDGEGPAAEWLYPKPRDYR